MSAVDFLDVPPGVLVAELAGVGFCGALALQFLKGLLRPRRIIVIGVIVLIVAVAAARTAQRNRTSVCPQPGFVSPNIPPAAVAVKGGSGLEKPLPPPGEVFSVAIGVDKKDAGAGVPNGKGWFADVAAIAAGGGSVVYVPEPGSGGRINYQHANACYAGTSPFGAPEVTGVPNRERFGGDDYKYYDGWP